MIHFPCFDLLAVKDCALLLARTISRMTMRRVTRRTTTTALPCLARLGWISTGFWPLLAHLAVHNRLLHSSTRVALGGQQLFYTVFCDISL